MNTFNNVRLKELRKNAGYTQLEMSEKINVARTTYAEYEQGKIQPPIDKIQRICKTFRISTTELVKVENNTGVDIGNLQLKTKMSDAEKILRISELQQKEKLHQTFADMCFTLQELDFEEKRMIMPIVTYLRNKYALDVRDIDIKKRIQRSMKND
jgi:transcriptional regulator with XRE-family HTH domain